MKNEKSKGRLIQNPNYDIPSLPRHTSERAVLRERKVLSHLLNPKWMGRGKVPFFEGTPGNRYSEDGVGPVAQRIRARGYEPRCRGFESLLAQPSLLGRSFPLLWGLKIWIRIAATELGCGSFVEIEWPFLFCFENFDLIECDTMG